MRAKNQKLKFKKFKSFKFAHSTKYALNTNQFKFKESLK